MTMMLLMVILLSLLRSLCERVHECAHFIGGEDSRALFLAALILRLSGRG